MSRVFLIIKFLLFIFRWFEKRGQIAEARKAVEYDLLVLQKRFIGSANTARSSVDHSSDSVRNDPDNRDNKVSINNTKSGV